MGYYSDVALCRIKTGGVFKTICWHASYAGDCILLIIVGNAVQYAEHEESELLI